MCVCVGGCVLEYVVCVCVCVCVCVTMCVYIFSTIVFSHGKSGSLSLGKASRDSHSTQPTVHAGCCSVSIIHQTLTCAQLTSSDMCAQLLMHATWGCTNAVRESALKVDFGRKILRHTGKSNLYQWHDSLMVYQLSYIPIPHI